MECRICNEKIHLRLGGAILCNKVSCKTIYKATEARTTRQKNEYNRIINGKECRRCHKKVFEDGMKDYCGGCVKQMNKKICKSCTTEVASSKMYCEVCKENKRVTAIKKQTAERKVAKEKGTKVPNRKPKKGIPEKFLVRGNVSTNNRASAFG